MLIPGTEVCITNEVRYFTLPSIATFVNDTLVFLAISHRLAANAATESNWRSHLLPILKGKGLYRMSKLLMQSGLIYYL